jgi:hypothetical protein
MRRTTFPTLPPTLNLAETCAQVRSQTSKGSTYMILNPQKLKNNSLAAAAAVPHPVFTPQPELEENREQLQPFSSAESDIKPMQILSSVSSHQHLFMKSSNSNNDANERTRASSAALELANMIKNSFMNTQFSLVNSSQKNQSN